MREFELGLVTLALMAIMLVVFAGYKAFGEEFLDISEDSQAYCTKYAKMHPADKAAAYTECVSVLPMRLPIEEPGTVPATGTTWEEACEDQYRTWDASDGTVIRRGSPERVRCPLALVDGEWVLP